MTTRHGHNVVATGRVSIGDVRGDHIARERHAVIAVAVGAVVRTATASSR